MEHSNSPSGWTCGSCERRVPRHIDECRCGSRRSDAAATDHTSAPAAEVEASGSGRRGLWLLALGLAAGAALALLPLREVVSTASEPPAQGVPTEQTLAAGVQEGSVPSTPIPAPAAYLPETSSSAVSVSSPNPNPAPPSTVPASSLEDIVSRVVPAVASIVAGDSRGTGFFIRPDQVLTNAHVIEGHSSVQLHVGGSVYTARVVTQSPGSDLAVLQVYNPNPNQPTLRLGSSSSARVGQEVIAVGMALGILSNTVTRGIVSAVRQAGNITLIQTDAAINPGNSGGPLVDRSGLVIGINSMKVGGGAGLAFAVAADHATALLNGQATVASQTPLNALNGAMSGRSEGDQMRTAGEQGYAKVLEWAARNADELDAYWNRYSSQCVERAPASLDRPWFVMYEPGGARLKGATVLSCGNWLENVQTNAAKIKTEVDKAAEAARQAGVYPGVMRDIRRRYRMQWQGWDR